MTKRESYQMHPTWTQIAKLMDREYGIEEERKYRDHISNCNPCNRKYAGGLEFDDMIQNTIWRIPKKERINLLSEAGAFERLDKNLVDKLMKWANK